MHTASKSRSLIMLPLLLAALLQTSASRAAPVLRVLTDVWGGNGSGQIGAGCTTYGPIPVLSSFFNAGGFRVLGGNEACGYVGFSADLTAAAGTLATQQTLQPVALDLAGGSYAGAAAARSAYGALGVSTSSALVGGTGPTTAAVSSAAAFFQDSLSVSSAGVAAGSAGFVRYLFSLDGALSSSAPQSGNASVQLNIQHAGGPVLGLARLSVQGADIGRLSAIDDAGGSWALAAGSAAGAGWFGSTVHVPFFGAIDLPIVWGHAWDLTVGMLAQSGRSAQASFLSSASLVELQFFDASHQRVQDVVLSAASGMRYPGGVAPVPEPHSWALWALGLAMLAKPWRRRSGAPT